MQTERSLRALERRQDRLLNRLAALGLADNTACCHMNVSIALEDMEALLDLAEQAPAECGG